MHRNALCLTCNRPLYLLSSSCLHTVHTSHHGIVIIHRDALRQNSDRPHMVPLLLTHLRNNL